MKMKCRILSVFVIAVSIVTVVISLIIIKNRKENTSIYAESISFVGIIGGAEIYLENDLIIDESIVKISPSNCTFKPELEIKKKSDEEYQSITFGKHSFSEEGSYTLVCKILKNKNYYIKDSINIKVVTSPDASTTSMYIKEINKTTLYVEDEIELSNIVETVSPTGAVVNFECNEHILLNSGIIKAVKDGLGTIDVTLSYDNITICRAMFIIVKPKIIESDITLKLTVGGNVLENNVVEIAKSNFYYAINYELINSDKQLIYCWTDSNIVEVISYNPMIIELKTLDVGNAIVYVSPVEYPNTVFEIMVKIV